MHHAHTIHIAFESARPLTVLRSSRKSPFAIYRDLFTQTFGASSPPLAIWPVRVSKRNIRQSLVAFATEIFVYIGHKLRVRVLQSEFRDKPMKYGENRVSSFDWAFSWLITMNRVKYLWFIGMIWQSKRILYFYQENCFIHWWMKSSACPFLM